MRRMRFFIRILLFFLSFLQKTLDSSPGEDVMLLAREVMIMKIKEVMKRTGLSEKSIRYYENMNLITPRLYERNGRSFRDYSEEDIRELQTVAILRKARFSIENIRRMKEDPAAIPGILTEYRDALEKSYDFLGALLRLLSSGQPERSSDLYELAESFEPCLSGVRLPEPDLKFNFRLLDRLEDERVRGISRIPLVRRFGWTKLYDGNDSKYCTELEMKLDATGIPNRVSSYTSAQRLIIQNSSNSMFPQVSRGPSVTNYGLQAKLLSDEKLDKYTLEVPTRYLTRAKAVL